MTTQRQKPDYSGRIKQSSENQSNAMKRGLDLDTIEYGTTPPYAYWEGDGTDLHHVLMNAHRQGLTIEKDSDRIGELIRTSRWFHAAAAREGARLAAREAEEQAKYRHHEFTDPRTAAEIETRDDRAQPLVVTSNGAAHVRVGHGATVTSADGCTFIGSITEVGDDRVLIELT